MDRSPRLARHARARQARRVPAAALVLAIAAGTATAQPRSPFAAWAADVSAPSIRAARSAIGRVVTVRTTEGAYTDAGRPLTAALDRSVPFVRGDEAGSLRSGGRGVAIGIVDGGADFAHAAFRDGSGRSRILWYLDMTQPSRGAPGPLDDFGHALFDRAALDAALADPGAPRPSGDPTGHGTRVAAVAAGSAAPYPGVAPQADLIVVRADRLPGGRFDEADVADALRFVFAAADLLGRPCVANVSLGGQLGAHDGTSLLELAVDGLVLRGPAGRAVVVSAGNDASASVRAVLRPTPGRPGEVVLVAPSNGPVEGAERAVVVVDLWSAPGRRFSVRASAPDGTAIDTARDGRSVERAMGRGAALRVEVATEPRPDNRRIEAIVALVGGDDGAVPPGSYRIEVTGDGPVDAYLSAEGAVADLFPFRLSGDVRREGTLSIPATARGAIAVGATAARTSWTNHLGEVVEDPSAVLGAPAAFSALGPTADGRFKPDLLAPGVWVISALAGGVGFPRGPGGAVATGSDPAFAAASGTSLAAPHVAGAVALMLAAEPGLSFREISARLRAWSRGGGEWAVAGGFGLLDAAGALAPPPASRMGEGVRAVVSVARPEMDPLGDRSTELAVAARAAGGEPRDARRFGLTLPHALAASALRPGAVTVATIDAGALGPGRCAAILAGGPSSSPGRASVCVGLDGPGPGGCALAEPARGTPAASIAPCLALLFPLVRGRKVRWWPFFVASASINLGLVLLVALVLPAVRAADRSDAVAVALVEREPSVPAEVRVEPPPMRPAVAVVEAPAPRPAESAARRLRRPRWIEAGRAGDPAAGGEVSASPAEAEPGGLVAAAGAPEGDTEASPSPDPTAARTAAPEPPAADPCATASAEVRARVEAAKSYPALARRRRLEGRAVVEFETDASGSVRAATLAASSGHDLLDVAALQAVRSAAPFPGAGCSYSLPVRFRVDRR